jgi:hypothetical protein
MRHLRPIVLLVFFHGVAGCGGPDRALAPSAPSPLPRPNSPATVVGPAVLRGSVADTAFRLLEDAKVEIVDGPRAGESVRTDSKGSYALAGPFSGTEIIRASKDGYVTGTRTFGSSLRVQNEYFVAFSLNVPAAPVNLAGEWTLALTADGACAQLPAEVRTRVYAATITLEPNSIYRPDDTTFSVALSGSEFVDSRHGFSIGVAGNDLGIWVSDPRLVERVAANTYLAIDGEARATASAPASTISAAFAGTIEYCESAATQVPYYGCASGPGVRKVVCESRNHRMTLQRR